MPKYAKRQLAAIWNWYRNNPEAAAARDKRRNEAFKRAQQETSRVWDNPNSNFRWQGHNQKRKETESEIQKNIMNNIDKQNFLNDISDKDVDQTLIQAYENEIRNNPNLELPWVSDADLEAQGIDPLAADTVDNYLDPGNPLKRKEITNLETPPTKSFKKDITPTTTSTTTQQQTTTTTTEDPGKGPSEIVKGTTTTLPTTSKLTTSTTEVNKKTLIEISNIKKPRKDYKFIIDLISSKFISDVQSYILNDKIHIIHNSILKDKTKFTPFIPNLFEKVEFYYISKCLTLSETKAYSNALSVIV